MQHVNCWEAVSYTYRDVRPSQRRPSHLSHTLNTRSNVPFVMHLVVMHLVHESAGMYLVLHQQHMRSVTHPRSTQRSTQRPAHPALVGCVLLHLGEALDAVLGSIVCRCVGNTHKHKHINTQNARKHSHRHTRWLFPGIITR